MSSIQSLLIHDETNIYGGSVLGKDTVVDARDPTMSFLTYLCEPMKLTVDEPS